MEFLKEVGAIAGLVSFVGLALLCLLYFAQARDVRRLRETASFLVERGSDDGETVAPAERAALRSRHATGAGEGRGCSRRHGSDRGGGLSQGGARPAGGGAPAALRAAPPAQRPRAPGVAVQSGAPLR